jgi:hypothetical protein
LKLLPFSIVKLFNDTVPALIVSTAPVPFPFKVALTPCSVRFSSSRRW